MDGRFDTSYPLLFSHPRMVADLLGGCLPEEWIGWLDLRTLERRDGDGPPERDGLVIWRCRWQGGSDWVYLLLKAQDEDDPFIALHLELCRNLFYRALLRRQVKQVRGHRQDPHDVDPVTGDAGEEAVGLLALTA